MSSIILLQASTASDNSSLHLTLTNNSSKSTLENKIVSCHFDDILLSDDKFVRILHHTINNFAITNAKNLSANNRNLQLEPTVYDPIALKASVNPDYDHNKDFDFCGALISLSEEIFRPQTEYSTSKVNSRNIKRNE